MMWLVQSRGGTWCAALAQAKEPDAATSVATACAHYILGPIGVRRGRHPTCAACLAAIKVRCIAPPAKEEVTK